MAGYEGFTKLGNGLWIDNRTQKIGKLKPTGRGGWYVEEITKQKFKRKNVQESLAREKYEKLEDEWNKAYQPYKNRWKENPKEDKALMDLAKRHDEALENMKMYQPAYLGKKSEYGRPTQYKGDISNLEGKHIAGREARAREIDKVNNLKNEYNNKIDKLGIRTDENGQVIDKNGNKTGVYSTYNYDIEYKKEIDNIQKTKAPIKASRKGITSEEYQKAENRVKELRNEHKTLAQEKGWKSKEAFQKEEELYDAQQNYDNLLDKDGYMERKYKVGKENYKNLRGKSDYEHHAGWELYSDDPNRYGDLRSYNEKMNPTKTEADNQIENINLKYLPRTTNTYAIEQKIEFDDGDKWVEIDRYKSKLKAKVKADRYDATRVFYGDEYRVKTKRTTAEYKQLGSMKGKYTQAEVDKIKAKVARFNERKGATKDNTISKSVSQLKNMYKNATEDEKAKIRAELNSRGYYRKNGRWTVK